MTANLPLRGRWPAGLGGGIGSIKITPSSSALCRGSTGWMADNLNTSARPEPPRLLGTGPRMTAFGARQQKSIPLPSTCTTLSLAVCCGIGRAHRASGQMWRWRGAGRFRESPASAGGRRELWDKKCSSAWKRRRSNACRAHGLRHTHDYSGKPRHASGSPDFRQGSVL